MDRGIHVDDVAYPDRLRSDFEAILDNGRAAHQALSAALYTLSHPCFASDETSRKTAAEEVCRGIDAVRCLIAEVSAELEQLQRERSQLGGVGRELRRAIIAVDRAAEALQAE